MHPIPWLLVILACFPIGACSPSGGDPRSSAVRARSQALDTAGCSLAALPQHPDGEALVREFVRRDAAGEFLRASTWFDGAVSCPGHEPGPDHVTTATGYSLQFLERSADSLRAEVVWARVGYGGFGGDATDPGTDYDTLAAIRTPFGWRIASPALNPHEIIPPPR